MEAQTAIRMTVDKRDPALVMRLPRLGSFHQSRLSFMRILIRRMKRERWTFSRPVFKIGANGVGHAVYCAHGPDRTYSLVAFAHDLPAEKRSDRVIAEAWDSTFTLFDGVPTEEDIDRLSQNVPLQEAGRVSEKELSLSRANRSARLWELVVSALAKGEQPDLKQVSAIGYLMRTTAVYGSGKFGAADREIIENRPEFTAPFQSEMLSVYLTRTYVRDLVQHMANTRGGDQTATLDPGIARSLGIGNSTGLGMAPFILNHPVLFNNWISSREKAISRVRSVEAATDSEIAIFREILARSIKSIELWHSEHPIQIEKLKTLRPDMKQLAAHAEITDLKIDRPWDRLFTWAEKSLSIEGQECLASLMLEPYGDLIDELADHMAEKSSNSSSGNQNVGQILGQTPLSQIKSIIEDIYDWALGLDWSASKNCARAWYVSEEKLEPRLGERFDEPIQDYEQPLAPARDAVALYEAISKWNSDTTLAEFLLAHPEHRHIARRVQTVAGVPYAEIRDNTISADVMPIDMLRCKLSFFGAIHFDPRSDRWVRICMYANAPYPEELESGDTDFWPYPELTKAGQ